MHLALFPLTSETNAKLLTVPLNDMITLPPCGTDKKKKRLNSPTCYVRCVESSNFRQNGKCFMVHDSIKCVKITRSISLRKMEERHYSYSIMV